MNFKLRYQEALAGGSLCVSLLMLSAVSASAQQKYLLREKDAVGDVKQHSESFKLTMSMKIAAANSAPAMKLAEAQQQKYRTEVLAVDASGHATDIRRAYSVYTKTQDGPGGKNVQTDTLQGKSARIRRVAGKVVVEAEKGTLDESARQELMSQLDDDIQYYPNRAVAIGEEWSPDSASVAKSFKGAKNLALRGQIVDIVPFSGHQCAHVRWKLSADMPQGEFAMRMNLQGDSYVALDIHHTLSMVFTGPMTMSGKTTNDGKTATMKGTGTADMKTTAEFTKVAGKSSKAKG